jgi:hypothetical protein
MEFHVDLTEIEAGKMFGSTVFVLFFDIEGTRTLITGYWTKLIGVIGSVAF